ncbi:hypothetical protein D3C87_1917200 [compost metagenome]
MMFMRLTTSHADMRRKNAMEITHQSIISSGKRRLRSVATPACSSACSTKEGSSKESNPSIEFGVEAKLWVSSSARARRIKKSDASSGIGF